MATRGHRFRNARAEEDQIERSVKIDRDRIGKGIDHRRIVFGAFPGDGLAIGFGRQKGNRLIEADGKLIGFEVAVVCFTGDIHLPGQPRIRKI